MSERNTIVAGAIFIGIAFLACILPQEVSRLVEHIQHMEKCK